MNDRTRFLLAQYGADPEVVWGGGPTLDASVISPVNVVAREDPNPRDWIFTFGSGHRAYAGSTSMRPDPDAAGGFPLADRYVVINGTFHEARARMCEIFGPVWCTQYGTRESAGIDEFGLVELVLTETRGVNR